MECKWHYDTRGKVGLVTTASSLAQSSAIGDFDTVKYLIENGADINMYPYAIRYALWSNHFNIFKYLHENGADLRIFEDCLLRDSAELGLYDIVVYLHRNGLYMHMETALQRCIMHGTNDYEDVIKYLIDNGANVDYLIAITRLTKVREYLEAYCRNK